MLRDSILSARVLRWCCDNFRTIAFKKFEKMPNVSVFPLLLIAAIIQTCVVAAPTDIVDVVDTKLDTKPDTPTNIAEQQGQREKRNYNYFGYGFPPMNPVIYPTYPHREETGGDTFGYEEPFAQIYKRLQDIVQVVRQPNLPPPPPPSFFPPQFPILFPVIYIPQVGCGCTPEQPPIDGQKPTPTKPPIDRNSSDVDVTNRFPDMEDERQNWGFVVNDTELDDGLGDDFTRPISFEPIRPPNRTMSRPSPPIEHGSSQAGTAGGTTTTTTTIRPDPEVNSVTSNPIAPDNPSACDGAVLSCCHQPQVTYDCFAAQGCPDPTSYGSPCDAQVILSVIDKFQRFYGQKSG